MTIPAISWGELWSIYRRSPEHVQRAILVQIDLPDFVKYASKKVKKEVFDEAPEEVIPKPDQEVAYVNPYSGMSQDELKKVLFPDPNRPMEYWEKQSKPSYLHQLFGRHG